MYNVVTSNIMKRFGYEKENLYLLADNAYLDIARIIKEKNQNTKVMPISSYTPENVKEIFDLPASAAVLLLAEPETYIKYELFKYLDFSKGEPQIENTVSRVLIFPKDAICRIFSGALEKISLQGTISLQI